MRGLPIRGDRGPIEGVATGWFWPEVDPEVNQPRMEGLQVLWDQTKVALLETKALDQVNIWLNLSPNFQEKYVRYKIAFLKAFQNELFIYVIYGLLRMYELYKKCFLKLSKIT